MGSKYTQEAGELSLRQKEKPPTALKEKKALEVKVQSPVGKIIKWLRRR